MKKLHLLILSTCFSILLMGCEESIPPDCSSDASYSLECVDMSVNIIEDGTTSLLTFNFFINGQPIPQRGIDHITCNDMEVPNSDALGYVITMPCPVSGENAGEKIYDCAISGNDQLAVMYLVSSVRPKITSPKEGEWITPSKDFTITYDPGLGWSAEWVRGDASLIIDGDLKSHLQGGNKAEQNNSYGLDVSSFTSGTGQVWLGRQIKMDLSKSFFCYGTRTCTLNYYAVDEINVFWK